MEVSYETGNHGGAAFILVYLACFYVGNAIMIAEFTVGRHSKASTDVLIRFWHPELIEVVGYLGFWFSYSRILFGSGRMDFGIYIGSGNEWFSVDKKPEDFVVAFRVFEGPCSSAYLAGHLLLATHFVIVKGVKDGIEKSSKVLMPGFVCTDSSFGGVLIVASQCGKRLEFLLKPDFSKVNGDVFLGAMGQAFFP